MSTRRSAPRNPYRYLEFEVWYQLLARAVLFHAVRAHLLALHEGVLYSPPVRRTLDGFYVSATGAATVAADHATIAEDRERLTTVVREFAAQARESAAQLGTSPGDRELLTDLARLADTAVARDPFAQLLGRVNGRAQAIYGDDWQRPGLSLARTTENPARTPYPLDPYPISARTRTRPRPVVEVVVDPLEFGPASYAALPMVLVHECVCHVGARQRGETSNESVFAEGFMDFAARYFFKTWIGAIDNALATAADHHGGAIARMYETSGSPGAATRRSGYRFASAVQYWMESRRGLGLPTSVALARVARLAVALNRVDSSLSEKDNLVSRFGLLSRPSGDRAYPRELAAVLRRWNEGSTSVEDLFIVQVNRN